VNGTLRDEAKKEELDYPSEMKCRSGSDLKNKRTAHEQVTELAHNYQVGRRSQDQAIELELLKGGFPWWQGGKKGNHKSFVQHVC